MNWRYVIPSLALCVTLGGCGSLSQEGTGAFRDKSKDYKYAETGSAVTLPNHVAASSVYEPLMPIPGEPRLDSKTETAGFATDTKGHAVPWTLASTPRPAVVKVKQRQAKAASKPLNPVAASNGSNILKEPYFRVWHQAALNAQEAGFEVVKQDEAAGILEVRATNRANDIPSNTVFSVAMEKISDTRTKMSVVAASKGSEVHTNRLLSIISQDLSRG